MKEIEVKFKIADEEAVIKQLQNLGCRFSEEIFQEDLIYIPNNAPGVPVGPGVNVLRLRQQPGKIMFTLKQGAFLAKTELELEISDAEKMATIIGLLDFKQITEVNKRRRVCAYQGYEICVDVVENLGSFLEMEQITDEDPDRVQQNMIALLQFMGISLGDRIHVGYDILMVEHNNPNKT